MRHENLSRALNSLAHPASIGAALVLLVNALVLQRSWPSWWTGKLGDLAWLVFCPFLVAAALAPFVPLRPGRMGILATLVTGIGFVLAKTWPPLNLAVHQLAAGLGVALKLQLDPSDLLALPGLLAAWAIWNRPRPRTPAKAIRAGAVALVGMAMIADSPAPVFYGVTCLVERDGVVYAYSEASSPGGYFGGQAENHWDGVYSSGDGGASWDFSPLASRDERTQEFECRQATWPLDDPQDSEVQLYLVLGQGVYASGDGGQTLRLEQSLTEVHGAVVHRPTGNVIVAAGQQGVYVRTVGGAWAHPIPPNG